MQSETTKLFYCHGCKKTVAVELLLLICPECSSDFLQEANMSEIESPAPRQVSFLDIVSIFSETSDPQERRSRILARIFQDGLGENPGNRPFRLVLRELMERSGRPVPASEETIQNINTVVVDSNETLECAICSENFIIGDEKKILRCQHGFHSECLSPWLKRKNNCPVCRQSIQ